MSETDVGTSTHSKINSMIPVQILSIQWLNWKKIEKDCKFHSTENVSNTIEKIVKLYNTNNSREVEDDGYVKSKDQIDGTVGGYFFEIYKCTISGVPEIERQTQKNPQGTLTYHYLVFCYKEEPRRVIALSSGQAWLVVRRYADHSFPVKVAEKVANPRKMYQLARHCLFGHITREDLLRPSVFDLYKTSNLYYFVENFKCDLKKDSSLFCLIKYMENTDRCWIRVTTGGILRIGKKIALAHFPIIFDQLAKYVGGEPTFDINYLVEIPDPLFEFLHFLQPASKSKNELDRQFIKDIFSQWNETKEPLVDVRHKNLEDFLLSTSFKIKIGSSRYKLLGSEPPEMKKIIEKIMEKINAENPYHEFEEAVLKSKLKFTDSKSKEQFGCLIDCVEGQMYFENEIHFKIKNMWYIFAADHLALLCDDFKKMLKKHLIAKHDEEQLPHPWAESTKKSTEKKTRKEEEIYNRSYLKEDLPGYMVFDQICPDNIEPCDILKYDDDKVYLYQVKKLFGKCTREACSQILNAATMFRGALSFDTGMSNYLEKLWNMATEGSTKAEEQWRDDVKRQVEPLGKDGFLDIFRNRKLVFVYAYLPRKNMSFSNLLKKIDEPPEDRIIDKLIKSGYFDSHRRLTGKFYSVIQEDFRLEGETIKTCKKIYNHLDAGRFSKSTLAKFELLRLAQNLHELNFEFEICEIIRAESGEMKS